VTYRVYRQYHIRQSAQSHLIDEVIRPGLINPRDACHIHDFIQLLFDILLLRLLIVVWPNRDLIISALHLMFVAMSQDRLIDAASLSTVCDKCLETQFNNCSIPGRSLDFLPLSPPVVFPIDIHSSDTFPVLDPLLGLNA
jgi:hypothetical protein